MEMMIAIVILGLAVTAIYTTFAMILKSSERIKTENAFFQNDQLLSNLLENDFQGFFVIAPPRYKKPEDRDGEDHFHVTGDGDYLEGENFSNIRFVSAGAVNPESTGQTPLIRVVYYVTVDDSDTLLLKRASSLELDEDFIEDEADPILVRGIKKFKLLYYDREGNEHETWNSESSKSNYETPTAISVTIQSSRNETLHSFEKTYRISKTRVMEK